MTQVNNFPIGARSGHNGQSAQSKLSVDSVYNHILYSFVLYIIVPQFHRSSGLKSEHLILGSTQIYIIGYRSSVPFISHFHCIAEQDLKEDSFFARAIHYLAPLALSLNPYYITSYFARCTTGYQ